MVICLLTHDTHGLTVLSEAVSGRTVSLYRDSSAAGQNSAPAAYARNGSGTGGNSGGSCFSDICWLPDSSGIWTVCRDRPQLQYFQLSATNPKFRCGVSAPFTCISASKSHIFGGSSSGQMYIWSRADGGLRAVHLCHFRSITKIVLYDTFVITAGNDATIHVWHLSELLAHSGGNNAQNAAIKPFRSFNDHSLPVVDIIARGAPGTSLHIYSISTDRTLKRFDLYTYNSSVPTTTSNNSASNNNSQTGTNSYSSNSNSYICNSGTCVFTCVLPSVPTKLCVCMSERELVVGGESGDLWRVEMFPFGGRDSSGTNISSPIKMEGHTQSVTGVEYIGDEGLYAVTTSLDGTCRLWSMPSNLCLRNLRISPHSNRSLSLLRLVDIDEALLQGTDREEEIKRRVGNASMMVNQPLKKYQQGDAALSGDTNIPLTYVYTSDFDVEKYTSISTEDFLSTANAHTSLSHRVHTSGEKEREREIGGEREREASVGDGGGELEALRGERDRYKVLAEKLYEEVLRLKQKS